MSTHPSTCHRHTPPGGGSHGNASGARTGRARQPAAEQRAEPGGNVGLALGSAAPTASIALTLAAIVAASSRASPVAILVIGLPMLGIAAAFKRLNRSHVNCVMLSAVVLALMYAFFTFSFQGAVTNKALQANGANALSYIAQQVAGSALAKYMILAVALSAIGSTLATLVSGVREATPREVFQPQVTPLPSDNESPVL